MRIAATFVVLASLRLATADDAARIMATMAGNVEKAAAERSQYVYQQAVRSRLLRTDGKVSRQERREYSVLPLHDKTSKELVKLEGEVHRGNDVTRYDKAGYRSKGMDIDGELLEDLTDDLVDDKGSRDGIPESLFPLRASQLGKYKFRLVETRQYKGRRIHHIEFEPKKKADCVEQDGECGSAVWKGDVYVDAEDLQPVHIATELAMKIPFFVRTVLGTNLRQTGFAISYQRVAENVWFPSSYGTEFRLDVFFGYKRVITLSLESSAFRRAAADSKITYAVPDPIP